MRKSFKFSVVTGAALLLSACASGDGVDTNDASLTQTASLTSGTAIAAGPGTISVRVSGEGFEGGPEMQLFMDGVLVGKTVVDWALKAEEGRYAFSYDGSRRTRISGTRRSTIDNLEWREVMFDVTMPEGGPDTVSILFENDKFRVVEKKVLDRNLIVDWIKVNGHRIEAEDRGVIYEGFGRETKRGREKMPYNGALVFDIPAILGTKPVSDETVAEK